jgi:hypothetical protein
MTLIRTPGELAARFRSDVDDPLRGPTTAPDNDCLWKIADVKYYMTVAASKVGRQGMQNFNTFTLPMVAGQAAYVLPIGSNFISDIRRMYLQTTRRELVETNIEDLKNYHRDYGEIIGSGGWETLQGYPHWFIRNYYPGQIRLVPIPTMNDTIEITAMLVPIMDDGFPLPFQDPIDLELMLIWMKKMAYSKNDADTYDSDKALKWEREFDQGILDRNSEARRVRRAPTRTLFQW